MLTVSIDTKVFSIFLFIKADNLCQNVTDSRHYKKRLVCFYNSDQSQKQNEKLHYFT